MSTKRTADVVFCMDASASMRPCFEAVCRHVNTFVDSLRGDAQTRWDIRIDFLAYSAGEKPDGQGLFDLQSLKTRGLNLVKSLYGREATSDFFTSDITEFKNGLARIRVGGDEASFVALDTALDFPWRTASACHRVLILLTDEALETGVLKRIQLEAVSRLIEKIHALHVLLFLVGPSSIAFDQISAADKSEYVVVDDSQNGLVAVDFAKILGAIAKSVSASALQAICSPVTAPRALLARTAGAVAAKPSATNKAQMPRQLRIGDTVNGYTAVDLINTGMMAWAFKATTGGGKVVFLKQYKSPSRAVRWYEAYKGYQRDLRRRLDDPAVGRFCVKLLDQFDANYGGEVFFQVYEFVHAGEDLGSILERIRKDSASMNWETRLILAKVMMAGINQLHAARIVHGDLKPPNLQLFRDSSIIAGWQLKLIDMDFSVLTDRRAPWDGEAGYVGTPGYLSPEHQPKQIPLPASDVFTCGLILYELLAQGHPYLCDDDETYFRSIKASRAEPPKLLGRISDEHRTGALAGCLHRCLSPNPAKRPTAREVNFALNGRLEEAGRTAPPLKPVVPLRPHTPESPLPTAPSAKPPRPSEKPKSPTPGAPASLKLVGNGGHTLELHINTPISSALLKSVGFGDEAEFADATFQFRVERRDVSWVVVPAPGTKNATILNGHAIEAEAPLKDGDVIALGSRGGSGKTALPLTIRLAV